MNRPSTPPSPSRRDPAAREAAPAPRAGETAATLPETNYGHAGEPHASGRDSGGGSEQTRYTEN